MEGKGSIMETSVFTADTLQRLGNALKKKQDQAFTLKKIELAVTGHTENLDYEYIEEDIMIPQRDRSLVKKIDTENEDFYFQMNDGTFLRDLFEKDDVTNYLPDEEYISESKQYNLNEAIGNTQIYLHGTSESGHSVCVKFKDYKPFFYLSILETVPRNEAEDLRTAKSLIDEMKQDRWLPWSQVSSYSLVYTSPVVGFRNGETKPFILLEFHTKYAYKRFAGWIARKFPPPKKSDIENETYQNDWVMGEEEIPDPVKFANSIGIQWCGWVKLEKGTYKYYTEEDICTLYVFETNKLQHEPLRQEIAPLVLDSFDNEGLRWDEQDAMPDHGGDPRDALASITHCLEISDGSWEPIFYIFTWGGRVDRDAKDEKGIPLFPPRTVLKIYRTEADMLNGWAKWRKKFHPDVWYGWNNYKYDLESIIARMYLLEGIDESTKCFQRIGKCKTEIKAKTLTSSALQSQELKLIYPLAGEISWDLLLFYKKDSTFKPRDFKLNTVAKEKLKLQKDDVHHSEIKKLFCGTSTERARLLRYNLRDVDITRQLFTYLFHAINDCRVNRIPMNFICSYGQQQKMFGGFHKVAVDEGFIVWRPHYHPILDAPIGKDEGKEELKNEEPIDSEDGIFKKYLRSQEEEEDILTEGEIAERLAKRMENLDIKISGHEGVRWMEIDHELTDMNEQPKVSSQNVPMDVQSPLSSAPSFSSLKQEDNNNNNNGSIEVTASATFIKGDTVKTYGVEVNPEKDAGKELSRYGFLQSKYNPGNTGKGQKKRDVDQILHQKNSRQRVQKLKTIYKQNLLEGANIDVKEAMKNASKLKNGKEKGFSGGYVIDPILGMFYNICIFDFSSLYPSIMISYKLASDNLVLDKRFANCPNVQYLDIAFNQDRQVRFAQNSIGVMNKHVKNLLDSREITKGVMKKFQARLVLLSKLVGSIGRSIEPLDQNPMVMNKDDKVDDWTLYKANLKFFEDKIEWQSVVHGLFRQEYQNLKDMIKTSTWKDSQLLFNQDNDKIFTDKTYFQQTCAAALEISKTMVAKFSEWSGSVTPAMKELIESSAKTMGNMYKLYCKFYKPEDPTAMEVVIIDDENSKVKNSKVLFEFYKFFQSEEAIANSKQNSLKTAANSAFGAQGAGGTISYDNFGNMQRKGMFTVMPVPAAVTYIGRKTIIASQGLVKRKYGAVIIYGDTDSIFVLFPESIIPNTDEGFRKTFDFCPDVAKEITALFSFPGSIMKIIHEKSARSGIFYGAKTYILDKRESKDQPMKIDIKGMTFSKRDCCGFVSKMCKESVNVLFKERSIEKAVNIVEKKLDSLVEGKFDWEEFEIYKSLAKSSYTSSTLQPHVELNNKIRDRTPGMEAKSGERVRFVYIDVGDFEQKKKAVEKIEEPIYAQKNGKTLDIMWYMKNQISKNITKIFQPIFPEITKVLEKYEYLYTRKYWGVKNTRQDLLNAFKIQTV